MKRNALVTLLARKRVAWQLFRVAQPGVSFTGVIFVQSPFNTRSAATFN